MRVISRRMILAALAAGLAGKAGAQSAPLHLLCFGNSLMAGFGLKHEDSFPQQLAGWLHHHAAPPFRISTAAISGDTTYGGRIRINHALRRNPDAVLVELGANDMLLGLSPVRAEKNLDVILRAARKGNRPVLLAGIGAIGKTEGFRREWDAIWPRLAKRHGCFLVPDLYAGIRNADAPTRKSLLQADGLHASARGTEGMVKIAGPVILEMLLQVRLP